MPTNDIRLELNGFESSSYFGCIAKGLIDDLFMDSPSDASLKASFTRFEDAIVGGIQISSSQGVFSAHASGGDPEETAARIIATLRRQLGEWKMSRWGTMPIPFY